MIFEELQKEYMKVLWDILLIESDMRDRNKEYTRLETQKNDLKEDLGKLEEELKERAEMMHRL
jgi:predicted  nucleic acid-binding Zn-ribbon protein